jgi:pectate lyase
MLQLHGTAFWIRRFRTLTAVRAAGKRASWASARGGFLVLLAFVAVAACETGVFDVDMGVAPASINLDVTDIDLVSGRAAVIQARVQDAKGKPINVGAGGVQIEWSSSDDWIASITPFGQAAARVTGGAAGTAEITAVVHHTVAQAGFLALLQGSSNSGGIRASSSVHVRPANLVAVAGDGQSGAVGSTLPGELVVRAVNESGQGVPNVEIQFAAQPHNGTLDPGSAVTDQEGRARTRWTLGAAAGVMKAEAGAHNRYKLTPVEFTATALEDASGGQVAASVTVSPTAATLSTGSTQQFSATVKDADGATISDPSLAWTSSNTTVATVDANGLVTAREAGSATLTARSDDASGTAALTVNATAAPPPSGGLIPAFPGAEGWGAMALNQCRSLPLVVHKVTDTNDSGAGSLRDVLENRVRSDRFDIVIFRTGGTIVSESMLMLKRSCVYIAGQTAPGSGILIRSSGDPSAGALRVSTSGARHDVVIRYLRLRHGFPSSDRGAGLLVSGTGGGHDIILDHISTSWAGGSGHLTVNRTSSTGSPTVRTSIQNSIVAEGFRTRGAMMYNDTESSAADFHHHSFHRNLVATVGHRFPRIHAGDAHVSTDVGVEIVNNLMYNPMNRFGEARWRSVVDWVKNYQDVGPHRTFTQAGFNRWEAFHTSPAEPIDPNDTGSLYIDGNYNEGFSGPEFETWRQRHDTNVLLPASMQRFTRLSPPPFPITEQSARDARKWVLDNAGASKKLDCYGQWVWNRDEVDVRIVGYVRSRSASDTPVSTNGETVESVHGRWPTMDPGQACVDSDSDGLPDAWEERYFGCKTCANPAADTPSGYLVIEHYLNGTDPNR